LSALTGIKVVDLTAVLMGPLASRVLGDMGADVIKVEAPTGDSLRAVGPMHNPGMGPLYMNANRNKRSIALNLKSAAGKKAMQELIRDADVLLYNVRPQGMARLGLDYESCRSINPSLIHVGCYGFSEGGPYAGKPAFDDLIQGLCAVPSLFADVSGGIPRYIPLAMVDRYAAAHVAAAVLGALFHKSRTGEGQSIELSMLEIMADCVLGDHSGGQMFDPPIGPPGYPRSLAPERHPYKTLDGHLCTVIYTDQHWRSFFKLIGIDLMDTDPRFKNLTSRTIHAREVHGMLEGWLTDRSTEEWLDAFDKADIPAMPLRTLANMHLDPHLQAEGFFQWHDHPSEGRVRVMRPASKWSRTQPTVHRHAPLVGEQTREILSGLGYTEAQIQAMLQAGDAVAAHPPSKP